MNIVSIDPGKEAGLSLWSPEKKLLNIGLLKDSGTIVELYYRFEAFKKAYNVSIAFIEDFAVFKGNYFKNAWIVASNIRVCKEVFPQHITLKSSKWGAQKYKKTAAGIKYKISIAENIIKEHGQFIIKKDHEADSILMANYIFRTHSLKQIEHISRNEKKI